VESAAAAFLDRGFDGTSMDDVAQQAGVTRLIVYRNFDSKSQLYHAVLDSVLLELASRFGDVDLEELRSSGAVRFLLPVARRHPDAFRLLARHAWHEPEFADHSRIFREHVIHYAEAMLTPYLGDRTVLDWAAHAAGSHLVDGICHWLDRGDAARDEDFATLMTNGLRALATAWAMSVN
jgi:AcrR family transcriptional regulator